MSSLVWLIAGIVLVVAELVGGGLVLLMLAGGAFAAAGVDVAFDPPVWVDFGVFSGVSVLLLAAVRPIARRHLVTRPQLLMNTDALPGQPAIVVARVDDDAGRVKIGGEIWSARAASPHDVFDVGAHVTVAEIDGATALVIGG